ncbi:MAG TPA: hypothetical protein VJ820_20090, partial [Propionibacteriaceae bacterium]|nr:hypothetical protein [Propionibacteriaceae bacterium]
DQFQFRVPAFEFVGIVYAGNFSRPATDLVPRTTLLAQTAKATPAGEMGVELQQNLAVAAAARWLTWYQRDLQHRLEVGARRRRPAA